MEGLARFKDAAARLLPQLRSVAEREQLQLSKIGAWIVAEACFQLIWLQADPRGLSFDLHVVKQHWDGWCYANICPECIEAREMFWHYFSDPACPLLEGVRFSYAMREAGVELVAL